MTEGREFAGCEIQVELGQRLEAIALAASARLRVKVTKILSNPSPENNSIFFLNIYGSPVVLPT